MGRSIKKGPYVDEKLLAKVEKMRKLGDRKPIKTWSRRSTIVPDFVGCTFSIHNGKSFVSVFITEANPNPGLLYDLTARPYLIWIVLAWISFLVNGLQMAILFKKKAEFNEYVPAILTHLFWILVSFFWNGFGLISPFIMKACVVQ